MRDPDNQVRTPPSLGEHPQPRPGISVTWSLDETHPRFAHGTREIQVEVVGGAADPELAAIPRAILVFDALGQVTDANPLAETLVGYTRLELVGQPIDVVASRLAHVEPLGRIRFVPESDGACVRHRNGRSIAVEVLLCPHAEDATLAILRSVETTEAGLREDDVAQIVHDLKNPLSTIALEVGLLGEKRVRDDSADVADMRGALVRITHNVEFLDRMVHDLLDLCSLDAGRLELHRRPTELRLLLEQIIDRVVPTRDRGRVSLEATAPVTTSIDDLRIERVVANLVQNALKYAPKASGIIVGLAAATDTIRVSVTDTGPGMTYAEAGYVFDKFRRASTDGAQEGSGLGLYVSKKIVEAHGGRIDVSSVAGAGSQFFFELPLIGSRS
jgi:PAS domain S-box-containing protein